MATLTIVKYQKIEHAEEVETREPYKIEDDILWLYKPRMSNDPIRIGIPMSRVIQIIEYPC